MSEKSVKITASSHWRDSESNAKDECNRVLDIKSQETISREEHDGSYLSSSSYSSYSVEVRDNKTLFRCTRSRTLRFKEYSVTDVENSVLDESAVEDIVSLLQKHGKNLADLGIDRSDLRGSSLTSSAETQDEYFSRIEAKVKERAVAGAECNTVIELKPEHHAA